MSNVINISDSELNEKVLDYKGPVVLMFEAMWCGTCHIMEPIFEEISQAYDEQLSVLKLDVDLNPETAKMYGIRDLPTTLFFNNGMLVNHIFGAVPKNIVTTKVESLLETSKVQQTVNIKS